MWECWGKAVCAISDVCWANKSLGDWHAVLLFGLDFEDHNEMNLWVEVSMNITMKESFRWNMSLVSLST